MKKAFTLIELLIYILLSTFIILIMFTFLNMQLKNVILFNKKTNDVLKKEIVLDFLKRDIQTASCNLCDWNKNNFIFKKYYSDALGNLKSKDISWKYLPLKKGFNREEGVYNFITKKWIKKIVNFIGAEFLKCKIGILEIINNNVTSVYVEYKSSNGNNNRFIIKLKNRYL